MARRSKWPNESMWEQAVAWRKGGLTVREICGRLVRPENMRLFGLEESPPEDTVQRQVNRRLDRADQLSLRPRSDGQEPEGWNMPALQADRFLPGEAAMLVWFSNFTSTPEGQSFGTLHPMLPAMRRWKRAFPSATPGYLVALALIDKLRETCQGQHDPSRQVAFAESFQALCKQYEPWGSQPSAFNFWDEVDHEMAALGQPVITAFAGPLKQLVALELDEKAGTLDSSPVSGLLAAIFANGLPAPTVPEDQMPTDLIELARQSQGTLPLPPRLQAYGERLFAVLHNVSPAQPGLPGVST